MRAPFPLLIATAFVGSVTTAVAEDAPRARPPVWTDDQRALFAGDARKLLVGPRPDFGEAAAEPPATGVAATDSEAFRWSSLLAADTVETEIKRQAGVVAGLVRSATEFKGGGYRQCRDAFSVLAVMFRAAGEHDDAARWRDRANGLAALFGRAGANCKVGADGTYREASARGEDLAELIRGGRPDTPTVSGQKWSDLADRSPLMRRMEAAQLERLTPLLGSARAFSRGADDARHEAEVLAALAEIITRDEFYDADDEEYVDLARSLRDAAVDLSQAAEQEDYESARSALGRVGQACSACHEGYRG